MNQSQLVSLFVEAVGWGGSACVIFAYAMNLAGKMQASSQTYMLLNVLGSLGLIINSGFHHAIPSFAVNIIWVGIGIHALFMYRRRI